MAVLWRLIQDQSEMEADDIHPFAQVESVRLISPQGGVQAYFIALRVARPFHKPIEHSLTCAA